MKRLYPLLLVLTVVLASSACNTVQGVGKDIRQGGEAIEKAAKESICEQETIMTKIAFMLLAIVSAVGLTACNTVHGIGKDIEKGGQAIEKAAK